MENVKKKSGNYMKSKKQVMWYRTQENEELSGVRYKVVILYSREKFELQTSYIKILYIGI